MSSYDDLRQQYKPDKIRLLLIAESPPPAADQPGSRHFYRHEERKDDRLFVNTIKAIYPEAAESTEAELEPVKEKWLQRLKSDGVYMIEALEVSQRKSVTKEERQAKIGETLPRLLQRVDELVDKKAAIVLIKSNVYDVAAEPLRHAGYNVLNTELVDYPGRFNQRAYREKLAKLAKQVLN